MIESVHMIIQVLSAAKLEIGVFLLAASLHFLLFSNPTLQRSLRSKSKINEPGPGAKEKTGPSVAIPAAVKQLVRSGAKKAPIEEEIRSLAAFHKVSADELQIILASAFEGLGRLPAESELLGAVRALVPAVTSTRLAEQLLRAYLGARARAEFEGVLQEVETHCKSNNIKLPQGIAVLAMQFALGADNLEAALARLPDMASEKDGEGRSASNWEMLDKLMRDFLPMIEDPHSTHVCFHRILDAVVKIDVDRSWDVLKRMEAVGLSPNNVTCSILLKGVQKGMKDGYLQKVMRVIDSRAVKDLDEVLLGSLYEACIRCGQVKYLLSYVQKLREESGFIQVKSAHTVGSIIRAYGASEDLDGVWATWNEMKRKQVQPTRITLGCMVEALACNDDAEGAYEIIQQALADPQTAGLVNAVTYSSVLKSFNHQKRFHRVWEIYEEMIRQKVEFSVTTYNALLDVCARSGEIGRAEPLLKDMSEQGVTPNIITFGTVIKAYCSANRLDQAFEVLKEMQTNTKLHPDEVTYNTLLDGCARYGLFDRGLEVLADMRKGGVAPSNYTLSVIAKLANRSKKPKKAFEMVEQLRKEFGLKLNMHVYNNLIHAATCDSDMAKAQEVFATMLESRVRPDGRSYTLLLRFCISQKAQLAAMALLRAAMGLNQDKDELTETSGEEGLHPKLLKVFLRPCSWAAAPLRGNSALKDDVIHDVFDFLSRSFENTHSLPKLLADVQKSMPSLRLPKSTTTRIFSRS